MPTPTTTESTATTVVIRDYFDVVVPIDDVTGDAVIPLRIRRFNRAQMEAFLLGWTDVLSPASARQIYRLHAADEQMKDESGGFVVPDEEIVRRRLADLSPEQLDARADLQRSEFEKLVQFCSEQITAHVWVPQTDTQGRPVRVQREDEEGQVLLVRTGADVAALFASSEEMLGRITRQIHDENVLTPEKKRASKLFSASNAFSPSPQRAAAGPRQGETAGAVAPAASVENEPASDPPATLPSGRTAE